MIGFKHDFTTDAFLDKEILKNSSDFCCLNENAPLLTLANILDFLPKIEINFSIFSINKTYFSFAETQDYNSILTYNGELYQCIATSIGNLPTDENFFIKTNLDSIRLKSYINNVLEKVKEDLQLSYNLIENQSIFPSNLNMKYTPINDKIGVSFEKRGSDYISIIINEFSAYADVNDNTFNLYHYLNNSLKKTISINNSFSNEYQTNFINLELNEKGSHVLAIDKRPMFNSNKQINPLRYDSFIYNNVELTNGRFVRSSVSCNGIGVNVSTALKSDLFLKHNLKLFHRFLKATFEYLFYQTILINSNKRINSNTRLLFDEKLLLSELKNKDTDSVLNRYLKEKDLALSLMKKTFDKQINKNTDEMEIEITTF